MRRLMMVVGVALVAGCSQTAPQQGYIANDGSFVYYQQPQPVRRPNALEVFGDELAAGTRQAQMNRPVVCRTVKYPALGQMETRCQ